MLIILPPSAAIFWRITLPPYPIHRTHVSNNTTPLQLGRQSLRPCRRCKKNPNFDQVFSNRSNLRADTTHDADLTGHPNEYETGRFDHWLLQLKLHFCIFYYLNSSAWDLFKKDDLI